MTLRQSGIWATVGGPMMHLRLNELMAAGGWPEPDVVDRRSWVAFDGEDPVGFLDVEAYDNKIASLSIVVRPYGRQRCYGTVLIGNAVDWARAHGRARLVAGAQAENLASLAILGKANFEL